MGATPICPKCGKLMIPVCPHCGKEVEVYSRIVGYLRPIKLWNDGKQEEFNKRTEFTVRKMEDHQKSE